MGRTINKDKIEFIRRLHDEGETRSYIAKVTGTNYETVSRVIADPGYGQPHRKRPYPDRKTAKTPVSRCPNCGYSVSLPCGICKARVDAATFKKIRLLRTQGA